MTIIRTKIIKIIISVFLLFFIQNNKLVSQVVVSTLAGNGISGYLDGQGTNAQFSSPKGLCFDGNGNVYVAEWGGGGRIRRIDPLGNVTTIVPAGILVNPNDIAVDFAGNNLYAVEWGANKISHIDIGTGVVSVIAGAVSSGHIDGPGINARFSTPSGIELDETNQMLFITEFGNHCIRVIDLASGSMDVSTLAGTSGNTSGCVDGVGNGALFQNPTGVALGNNNDLFVADWGNHIVRRIEIATGIVSTIAGACGVNSSVDGPIALATFSQPHGLFVDAAGTIYVAEESGNKIRMINSTSVSTYAGTGVAGFMDGPALTSQFNKLFRVTGDCSGFIYVADQQGHRIRLITDSSTIPTFSGLDSQYCSSEGSTTLVGNPSGGVFSGAGVVGNNFYPTMAGIGTHLIQYDYTNNYGCTLFALDSVDIIACCDTFSLTCNNYVVGTNNLVVNGDFELGNNGFLSSYLYVHSTSWLNGGEYDVVDDASWTHNLFAPCTDHSTSTGNMMVVNGQSVPNENVWCQTINVQPCTNYEFTTWITSVSPQSPALLEFSINGLAIGNLIAPSSVTCDWQQFFATWNSGNSTQATICIVNQNVAAQGNDFALDDISFYEVMESPCIADTLYFDVSDYNGLDSSFIFLDNTLSCVDINNISFNFENSAFTTSSTITLLQAGEMEEVEMLFQAEDSCVPYSLTSYVVVSAPCPTYVNDTIWLIANYEPPVFQGTISSDTIICKNDCVTISAGGGSDYLWTPAIGLSNPLAANPLACPDSTINYEVVVSNIHGCTDSLTITISVNPVPEIILSSDTALCYGDTIQIFSSGGDNYVWQPNSYIIDNEVSNPYVYPMFSTYYSVNVLNSFNCSSTDSIYLDVYELPEIIGIMDISLCYGDSTQISLNEILNAEASWTPSIGLSNPNIFNPFVIASQNMSYNVIVTDDNGCIAEDSLEVDVFENPIADFLIQITDSNCFVAGYAENLSVNGATYNWFIDGELQDDSDDLFFEFDSGNHILLLETYSSENCKSVMEIELSNNLFDTPMYVPNVFTPNDDGNNDSWFVVGTGECLSEFECLIFNRWGSLIYTLSDVDERWYGRTVSGIKVSQGVYVYVIKAKKTSGERINVNGHISVFY